jgi:nucleotide-binding universal stress UspA family protein
MTPPILVPLDGSSFAEQALPTALDLAARTGGRVHLVRVRVPEPGAPPTSRRLDRRLDEAAEYLRGVADRTLQEAGLTVRTEVLEGPIATELVTYAQTHDIGLVVLTSHGQGGINRAWVGSIADALVRRMRIPVLLLRPSASVGNGPLLPHPRNILVPLDGSELSTRVIEHADRLGQVWGSRLTLLHVLPPRDAWPRRDGDLAEGAVRAASSDFDCNADPAACAELVLDELAAPLRRRGHAVDIAVVEGSGPAQAVLDFAATHAVDAIAIATRGRGGWERVAVGSVADKVIRGSLLPLVLYRPPGISYMDVEAGLMSEVAPAPAIERAPMRLAG